MIDDQSTYGTPQSILWMPRSPLEHLKLLRQHSETSQKHALTYGVQNQRLERSIFVDGSPTRKSLIEEK